MVSERSARFSANLPGRFRRPSPRVVCPKELRFRKHPWRICFVIASMALFGFVLCAQDKNLTLTSETELVLVPTVINDKFGSHVPGLTKDDFRLKQDGKTFPIAVFEELKTTAPITYSPERNQETFSNFAPGHEENRRLSIVVLDFVNTPPSDQNNARQGLLKFLLDVGDSRESILLLALTREGLVVLHDFCIDPKILAEAVRKVGADTAPLVHETVADAGHPPSNDMMAAQIARMVREQLKTEAQMSSLVAKDQALITVRALQQIARAFRGFPGRKALIWTSSGFPFSLSSPASLLCEPACPVHQRAEVQSAYDNLWKMMNDAQIAIYSVDLRAPGSPVAAASEANFTHPADIGDPQFDVDAQSKWKINDTSSTLQLFAQNTGGKAFLGGSNLVQSFRQAFQDDSSYYLLGFYVSANATKSGWHDIAVSLHSKGAHLRYRNGYFFRRDRNPDSLREEIDAALSSPLDYTGIPVSVAWKGREPGKAPGTTNIQFEMVMPANFALIDESDQNHMVVDIAVLAKTAKGDAAASLSQRIDAHIKTAGLEQIQHNGMTFRNRLQLEPGDYTVRFVVRDALGSRVGSVSAPVLVTPQRN
jgi:VWFA-related protein